MRRSRLCASSEPYRLLRSCLREPIYSGVATHTSPLSILGALSRSGSPESELFELFIECCVNVWMHQDLDRNPTGLYHIAIILPGNTPDSERVATGTHWRSSLHGMREVDMSGRGLKHYSSLFRTFGEMEAVHFFSIPAMSAMSDSLASR